MRGLLLWQGLSSDKELGLDSFYQCEVMFQLRYNKSFFSQFLQGSSHSFDRIHQIESATFVIQARDALPGSDGVSRVQPLLYSQS